MLDTTLAQLRVEIAMGGPQGLPIGEVWVLVKDIMTKIVQQNKKPNAPGLKPTVDEPYKRIFWPCIAKSKELMLYEDLDFDLDDGNADKTEDVIMGEVVNDGEAAVEDAEETRSAKQTAKAANKRAGNKRRVAKKAGNKKKGKKPVRKNRFVDDDDDDYSEDEYVPSSEEDDDEDEDFDEELMDEDEDEGVFHLVAKETKKEPEKASREIEVQQVKTNYRLIEDADKCDWTALSQRYGPRIRIVASERLQNEQLYVAVPPGRSLSPNLIIVLKTILSSRAKGITQADLTKVLGLDPRSAGHYVKVLTQKGYIVRKPVSMKGIRTNLCVHAQFNRDNMIAENITNNAKTSDQLPYNVNVMGDFFTLKQLRNRMVELFLDAKDYIMYTEDVLKALGFNPEDKRVKKWFHRGIDELCNRGLFRKVNARGGGRASRCLELLNPEEAKRTLNVRKGARINEKPSISGVDPVEGGTGYILSAKPSGRPDPVGVYRDTTLENRIVEFLDGVGPEGATQKQIGYNLKCLDNRSLTRALEKLCSFNTPDATKYMCRRELEFEGRIRRYRYYTFKHYHTAKGNPDVEETGPPPFKVSNKDLDDIDFTTDLGAKVKKLGRPPKNPDAGPEQGKKRGRPPKKARTEEPSPSEVQEDTQSPASVPAAENVKKKRGRPPKHPRPEEAPPAEVEEATQSSAAVEKESAPQEESSTSASQSMALDESSVQQEKTAEQPSCQEEMATQDEKTVSQPSCEEDTSMHDASAVDTTQNEASAKRARDIDDAGRSPVAKRIRKAMQAENPPSNIVRLDSGLVSARHLRDTFTTNAYFKERREILLKLLEDQPFYERGFELRNAFNEKKAQLHGENASKKKGHVICLKTLWKTVEEMAKMGEAQVLECEYQQWNGTKAIRKIFARPGVDPADPEIQNYLRTLREKKTLYPTAYKLKKSIRVERPVERLNERLERMEQEQALLEGESSAEASRIGEQIKTIRANMDRANQLREGPDKGGMGNWLMIAMQFGYINSRMVRTKLLHQHVFSVLQRNSEGVDKERRLIPTTTIVNEMTLTMYFQVIGLFSPSVVVREYLKDVENFDKLIYDTPETVRAALFGEPNKFRRRLRTLYDVLLFLNLADVDDGFKPILGTSEDSNSSLPFAIILQEKVPMRSYRTEGFPIVREYKLENPTDIMIYWSDLQYLCTSSEVPLTADIPPRSEYAAIITLKNWSVNFAYTREQRKALNSYVNKTTGKTPLKNLRMVKEIAAELNMSAYMVSGYFRKVEEAYQRKIENSMQRKTINRLQYDAGQRRTRRKRKMEEEDTHKSISLSTGRPFKRFYASSTRDILIKQQRGSGANDQVAASAQEEDDENQYLDRIEDIPCFEGDVEAHDLRRPRRVLRVRWTPQEDDLLLYTYAILNVRSRFSRFLWSAATTVLPQRTANQCRNRLVKLRNIPKVADQIVYLTTTYRRYYEEGIQRGDIVDPQPEDMINFDILGQLSYFVKRLQEGDVATKSEEIPLPSSLEELHDNYYIDNMVTKKKDPRFEDAFHRAPTMAARGQSTVTQFFRLRGNELSDFGWTEVADMPESNDKQRLTCLISVAMKMTLLTPKERYDPFYAYAMLHQYPTVLLEQIIEGERQRGLLVKAKGHRALDRRVPGTLFSISALFLKQLATSFPEHFFVQAASYSRYLRSHEQTLFPAVDANSGMMACLLDLISQGKISLSLADEERQRVRLQKPIYRSRLLDQSKTNVPLAIQYEQTEEESAVAPAQPQGYKPMPVDIDESTFTSEWSGFYSLKEPPVREVVKVIRDLLESARDQGASLLEIKAKLKEKDASITDEFIHECLDMLRTSTPPLLLVVGFEAERYVLPPYADNWVVRTKSVSIPEPVNKETAARSEELARERKALLLPRLWVDINGTVTPSVLEGCLEAVFQQIMERPGIRGRDVQRLLEHSLTYAEVKDALDYLVARGAVRKITTIHSSPGKVGLFSKPRVYTRCAPTTIDPSLESSYLVNPGYYNCLGK